MNADYKNPGNYLSTDSVEASASKNPPFLYSDRMDSSTSHSSSNLDVQV